jgi:hypothetical protein
VAAFLGEFRCRPERLDSDTSDTGDIVSDLLKLPARDDSVFEANFGSPFEDISEFGHAVAIEHEFGAGFQSLTNFGIGSGVPSFWLVTDHHDRDAAYIREEFDRAIVDVVSLVKDDYSGSADSAMQLVDDFFEWCIVGEVAVTVSEIFDCLPEDRSRV